MALSAVRTILIASAAFGALGALCRQNGERPEPRPASRVSRVQETPTTNPRDRYSSARPLTIDRFRSVFTGLDTDGNGILTNKEAKAAGQTELQFQRFDADRNGIITLDEFEWIYGSDLRDRGQIFDITLLQYFEKLNDRARASQWNIRGAEPGDATKKDPTKPAAKPESNNNSADAGLSRNRYGSGKAESAPAPKLPARAAPPATPKAPPPTSKGTGAIESPPPKKHR